MKVIYANNSRERQRRTGRLFVHYLEGQDLKEKLGKDMVRMR